MNAVRVGLWQSGEQKSVSEAKIFAKQNNGPRVVLGNDQRGPSSTPSDEEGFIYGVWTDAKGSDVRIFQKSKNVREQLEPVNGGQLANTCKHVGDLEGFSEKAVGSGGETRLAHFTLRVGTHDQDSRIR